MATTSTAPPLPSQTVCLCMIVKDETRVLPKCFDSVLAAVPGLAYWVICDTGSTDGTPDYVRGYFREKGIPGELHEDEWRDFGHNRTLAMRHAKGKSDYILMIDADDLLEGTLALPPGADAVMYYLNLQQRSLAYKRLQVFRGDCDWRYVGVVHEYPKLVSAPLGTNLRSAVITTCKMRVRMCGARSRQAVSKFVRDIRLLLEAVKREPENARHHYYLAQSYRDNGDLVEAVRWYEKRAAMGGWYEEAAHARYMVGVCKLRLRHRGRPAGGATFEEGEYKDFMEAFAMFKGARLEPLYHVVRHYRLTKQHRKGVKVGLMGRPLLKNDGSSPLGLFVEKGVYEYMFADELSIVAYWAGGFRLAYETGSMIFRINKFPARTGPRLKKNLEFSARKLGHDPRAILKQRHHSAVARRQDSAR